MIEHPLFDSEIIERLFYLHAAIFEIPIFTTVLYYITMFVFTVVKRFSSKWSIYKTETALRLHLSKAFFSHWYILINLFMPANVQRENV